MANNLRKDNCREIGAQGTGKHPSQTVTHYYDDGATRLLDDVDEPPGQEFSRSLGSTHVPVNARQIRTVTQATQPPRHQPQGPVPDQKTRDQKDRLAHASLRVAAAIDRVAQEQGELEQIIRVRSHQLPDPADLWG